MSRDPASPDTPGSVKDLRQLADQVQTRDVVRLRKQLAADGETVRVSALLPRSTARKVLRLLELEREGGATVVPTHSQFDLPRAARLLGIAVEALQQQVADGTIAACQVGGRMHIHAETVIERMEADDSR